MTARLPESLPCRVQLSRAKGWRMPPNTVNVARPGKWGNPFWVSRFRDAETCVALFRNAMTFGWDPGASAHLSDAWCGYKEWLAWQQKRPHLREMLGELRGKNLACWCKPGQPCHADVLLEIANR